MTASGCRSKSKPSPCRGNSAMPWVASWIPARSFASVAMLPKCSSYCVAIGCLPTMHAKQLVSVTTATLAAISIISASP